VLLGPSLLITSAVMIANFRQLGQRARRGRRVLCLVSMASPRRIFFNKFKCFAHNERVVGLTRRLCDENTKWIACQRQLVQSEATTTRLARLSLPAMKRDAIFLPPSSRTKDIAIQKPISALSSYFNPVKVNKFILPRIKSVNTFSSAVGSVLLLFYSPAQER
jgi:hypothetical protein